jgi:acyl-coenzyme A thioesterase PaaI-like protein
MAKLRAREGHDAQVRREGVENLAAATRALADAVAETGVDRAALDEVTGALELLTRRLRAEVDDDAYSGLVVKPVDYSVPQGPMPLNPIIGACNPTRPDVQLRFADGEVVGNARFTRRFTGPPGLTHGGISAMLADQIVALTGGAVGTRCITKALHVRFRRPLPLHEPVELWGVCDMSDPDNITARYTITAGGDVAVQGTGELVTFQHLAERNDLPKTR